ncbi:hypothetical protein ABH930_000521 [Kitasatospora sp. GAS204A]|nr:hypothetical protein [Kitasatospora sp. GAS204B]MDH6119279.1 hypothetical protein [Kitasatospora sp. GAS204B]
MPDGSGTRRQRRLISGLYRSTARLRVVADRGHHPDFRDVSR